MAPNVNSVLTVSRLDGINSNGLNKEISQAKLKLFINFCLPCISLLPHIHTHTHAHTRAQTHPPTYIYVYIHTKKIIVSSKLIFLNKYFIKFISSTTEYRNYSLTLEKYNKVWTDLTMLHWNVWLRTSAGVRLQVEIFHRVLN